MNDGGPAFPVFGMTGPDEYYRQKGMSLRNWFAGMALNGMLTRGAARGEDGAQINAADAYTIADAMLEEGGE